MKLTRLTFGHTVFSPFADEEDARDGEADDTKLVLTASRARFQSSSPRVEDVLYLLASRLALPLRRSSAVILHELPSLPDRRQSHRSGLIVVSSSISMDTNETCPSFGFCVKKTRRGLSGRW